MVGLVTCSASVVLLPYLGGGPYLSMGKREKTPYFRDIFTFCVPVGSLVLLQGPYFLCFVQIHARSVNSVYSYENLSVCDYSNLFNLTLAFAKKIINCIFGSLYGCPGSFSGPYLVKKMPILHCSHMGPNLEALSQLRAFWV